MCTGYAQGHNTVHLIISEIKAEACDTTIISTMKMILGLHPGLHEPGKKSSAIEIKLFVTYITLQ